MKRKCGTCKYFEDRGVANSGTCQHIQRRELRDVVLVRQSELACRNSWDQDLWEPATNIAADDLEPAGVSNSDGSRQDREPDDIFRGVEDVPMLSPFGEAVDRVTDIQVPVTRKPRSPLPVTEFSQQPSMEAEDDDWMARPSVYEVRKRLEEERRQQIQERQAAERQLIEEQMASDDAMGAPRDTVNAWSGNGRSLTFGRSTAAPERSSLHGSGFSDFPVHQTRLEGSVYVAPPSTDQTTHNTTPSQGTEPLPTQEVQKALSSGHVAPAVDGPVINVDGGVYGKSFSAPLDSQDQHTVAMADPLANDPVDRDSRASAVKRCCGTCRDFRQVGDGSRGQCVNPYAFSERRMVQSDQLACRSSLGMWWMPSDEVWLERADTSHHGRPTPLLDAALKAEKVSDGGRESHRWE